MHAEPTVPVAAEVFGLIGAVLAEVWLLCCIWDALRKGWLDVRFSEGLYRRDDPLFFWLYFVWVVFMAIFVALCLVFYCSHKCNKQMTIRGAGASTTGLLFGLVGLAALDPPYGLRVAGRSGRLSRGCWETAWKPGVFATGKAVVDQHEAAETRCRSGATSSGLAESAIGPGLRRTSANKLDPCR